MPTFAASGNRRWPKQFTESAGGPVRGEPRRSEGPSTELRTNGLTQR